MIKIVVQLKNEMKMDISKIWNRILLKKINEKLLHWHPTKLFDWQKAF